MSVSTTGPSVGRDGSLQVQLPSGPITLNYTSFEAQQQTHQDFSRPVNGNTIPIQLPDHWSAKFTIDRNGPALEDAIAAIEATYWAGGNAQLTGITIYQFINEPGGGTSTFQLDGCTIKLTNAGTYKQDGIVTQELDVLASTRKKV